MRWRVGLFTGARVMIFSSGELKMKPRRNIFLPLLAGLFLFVFVVALAQTSTQQVTSQTKQAESCCAMDSCCCHGDSCAMKQGEQNQSAKPEGGCCCGESCDMSKHDQKNHAAHGSCCGESCDMKMKHEAKHEMKKHSGEHKSCCVAATGAHATKHDAKNHDAKNHDAKQGCCCCGDSCNHKAKNAAG